MKVLKILVFCFLVNLGAAATKVSGNIGILRNFCVMLSDELNQTRPDIPSGWNQIDHVRLMKAEVSAGGPKAMRLINSMALIPSYPLIPKGISDISGELEGLRVLAISRYEVLDLDAEPGRYLILLEDGGRDRVSCYPVFVKESVADILIAQLVEIDLSAQPRAFDEAEISKLIDGSRPTQRGQGSSSAEEEVDFQGHDEVSGDEGGRFDLVKLVAWVGVFILLLLGLLMMKRVRGS